MTQRLDELLLHYGRIGAPECVRFVNHLALGRQGLCSFYHSSCQVIFIVYQFSACPKHVGVTPYLPPSLKRIIHIGHSPRP